MTNSFPSTALKARQYVSPGRSFALRSAGLGSSQFCPSPRSLQHNHELQLLCERPLLKICRSAPDERGQRKPQNSAIDPILKLKTFKKNKNADSILYQTNDFRPPSVSGLPTPDGVKRHPGRLCRNGTPKLPSPLLHHIFQQLIMPKVEMRRILTWLQPNQSRRHSAQHERRHCLRILRRQPALRRLGHDQVQQIFLPFKLITKRTNRSRKIVGLQANAQQCKLIGRTIQSRIKHRKLDPLVTPNAPQNPCHDLVPSLLLRFSWQKRWHGSLAYQLNKNHRHDRVIYATNWLLKGESFRRGTINLETLS